MRPSGATQIGLVKSRMAPAGAPSSRLLLARARNRPFERLRQTAELAFEHRDAQLRMGGASVQGSQQRRLEMVGAGEPRAVRARASDVVMGCLSAHVSAGDALLRDARKLLLS